jgi:mono/diheme cytochrome c family protein
MNLPVERSWRRLPWRPLPALPAGLALLWIPASLCGCEGGADPPDPVAERGKKLFEVTCAGCHQATGAGKEGVGMPLAGSPWVEGPEARLARIALHGVRGPIEVSGRVYNLEMPAFGRIFNDEELAAILTYIRQAWSNRAPPVPAATIAAVRAATADRGDSWTAAELAGFQ